MDDKSSIKRQLDDNTSAVVLITPSLPAEARDVKENWSGVTDPAKRRKLQNRLHQRAWRKREAEKRDAAKRSLTGTPSDDASFAAYLRDLKAVDKASLHTTLCRTGETAFLRVIDHLEQRLQTQDLREGPRLEILSSLIKFNVYRGLRSNNESLGWGAGWGTHDAISPFFDTNSVFGWKADALPLALQPTTLQATVEHHPWIDLLPEAAMRDNILRLGEEYDDGPLCYDILEDMSHDRSGLVLWGDPWDPRNWEVTEAFACRWPWVLQGCIALLEATNAWRSKRGETRLFSNNAIYMLQSQD